MKCWPSSASPRIRSRRCAPRRRSNRSFRHPAIGGASCAAALHIERKPMANKKTEVRRVLDKVKAEARTSLTAPEGKLVCDAYGIPVPREGVAKSAAEAAKLASGMGFPVVMKIVSPDILHKTEAGGVLVGVKSAEDAQKAFDTI